MEFGWVVLALITGIIIGWSAKTATLVNSVSVRRSGDHWLLYLGRRIVGNTGDPEVAQLRKARLISTLRGRMFERG